MRIVGYIPNRYCKITVFEYKGGFSVKCETPMCEQFYKLNEDDLIEHFDDVNQIFNKEFIDEIVQRMQQMQSTLINNYKRFEKSKSS